MTVSGAVGAGESNREDAARRFDARRPGPGRRREQRRVVGQRLPGRVRAPGELRRIRTELRDERAPRQARDEDGWVAIGRLDDGPGLRVLRLLLRRPDRGDRNVRARLAVRGDHRFAQHAVDVGSAGQRRAGRERRRARRRRDPKARPRREARLARTASGVSRPSRTLSRTTASLSAKRLARIGRAWSSGRKASPAAAAPRRNGSGEAMAASTTLRGLPPAAPP